MSKYVCENCKKQIENEADSLIIDKMSGSGEADGYLAICPELVEKKYSYCPACGQALDWT